MSRALGPPGNTNLMWCLAACLAMACAATRHERLPLLLACRAQLASALQPHAGLAPGAAEQHVRAAQLEL